LRLRLNTSYRLTAAIASVLGAIVASAIVGSAVAAKDNPPKPRPWFEPGVQRSVPAQAQYANATGRLGFIYTGEPIDASRHAFFQPLGENGRACVSCHQPADGMSLSLQSIQERWHASQGKDPLFAAIDGQNCPNLPAGEASSHSLLLERGLIRIPLPWPPRRLDGSVVEPEFSIEVVSDPTGCNTDPVYGLNSPQPTISVFRRPRATANLTYVINPRNLFNTKTGFPVDRDPDTGEIVSMNMMSDARAPTLKYQALDAMRGHLQAYQLPSTTALQQIIDFQSKTFVAQTYDTRAGEFSGPSKPTGLGPEPLATLRWETSGLGDNQERPVFGHFTAWRADADAKLTPEQAHRASIARGHDVFFLRPFWIRDAVHLNSIGLGNPIKRTCSTCHNSILTGQDVAPGWMDIGTTNRPWASISKANARAELPLFKLTCKPSAVPHPYLGRTVYTHDPGRALISGLCEDIGSINIQQMRGLAARAPYFSNGLAKDLYELVDFYDQRFSMKLTPQEREDLVNFLSSL
jgi:hypothetical protein